MHSHILKMGKSGNTVCNDPDRKDHCDCPGSCTWMNDQHKTCHHTQTSSYQRKDGTESGKAFHSDIQNNICNSCEYRKNSTYDYDPGNDSYGLSHNKKSKDNQNDSYDQFCPSDIRLSSLSAQPPMLQSSLRFL